MFRGFHEKHFRLMSERWMRWCVTWKLSARPLKRFRYVRSNNPAIEWQKIAGLRDILIHEYFGIDIEIIWDIVQNKLPTLAKQIKQVLAQSEP